MKFSITLFFFLALIFVFACSNPVNADDIKKPDLIIEDVTYTQRPSVYRGSPSGVLVTNGLVLEFTLRIKNIGTADFTSTLNIKNTRHENDMKTGHYPHGQLVYYYDTLRTHFIVPGQVIQVRVQDIIDRNISSVKFLIATDGMPHIKKGTAIPPRVEELNYDNNTYMLKIKK